MERHLDCCINDIIIHQYKVIGTIDMLLYPVTNPVSFSQISLLVFERKYIVQSLQEKSIVLILSRITHKCLGLGIYCVCLGISIMGSKPVRSG